MTIDRLPIRLRYLELLPQDIELTLLEIIEKEFNLLRRIESLKKDLMI